MQRSGAGLFAHLWKILGIPVQFFSLFMVVNLGGVAEVDAPSYCSVVIRASTWPRRIGGITLVSIRKEAE